MGFGPFFVSICYVIRDLYRGFSQVSFVFFELVTWLNFTLIAFGKKGNADWSKIFWPSENKLHHRKARGYEKTWFFDRSRLLVCSSFDSGPCVACLVRMRDDVLLLHNWNNNCYSVYEYDSVSLRHSCRWINRGKGHISLVTFWLQLLTSIVLVATNGWVCMNRWKSTLKPRPTSHFLSTCSCTDFLPGLSGQLISVTYPRRTPRTTWPETNDWGEVNLVSGAFVTIETKYWGLGTRQSEQQNVDHFYLSAKILNNGELCESISYLFVTCYQALDTGKEGMIAG